MSAPFIPAIVGGLVTAVAGKKIAKKNKLLGSIMMVGGAVLAGGAASSAMSAQPLAASTAAAEAAPSALIGEGAAATELGIGAADIGAATSISGEAAGAGLLDSSMSSFMPSAGAGNAVTAAEASMGMPSAAVAAPTATLPTPMSQINALNMGAEGTIQQVGGRTFVVQGGQLVELPAEGLLSGQGGMMAAMIGGNALSGYMQADEAAKARREDTRRWNATHEAGRFDTSLLDQAATQYIGNRNAGAALPNIPQTTDGLLEAPRYV